MSKRQWVSNTVKYSFIVQSAIPTSPRTRGRGRHSQSLSDVSPGSVGLHVVEAGDTDGRPSYTVGDRLCVLDAGESEGVSIDTPVSAVDMRSDVSESAREGLASVPQF